MKRWFIIFLLCVSLVGAEALGNDPFEGLGGANGELARTKIEQPSHSVADQACKASAVDIANAALLDQTVLQPIVKMFEDVMTGLKGGIGYDAEEMEEDLTDWLEDEFDYERN